MLQEGLLVRVLAVALVVALAGVAVLALGAQDDTQSVSELYLLGEDGQAADYPQTVVVGETVTVRVGVVNGWPVQRSYRLIARFANRTVAETDLVLAPGKRAEHPVSFSPRTVGDYRFRAELYEGRATEPALTVRLHVSVTGQTPSKPAQDAEADPQPLLE